MTISVEQIKKLIDDYWGYERECSNGDYDKVSASRAALYRTVIMDLEDLLPRKSMADIPPDEWPQFVGTWVEYDGVKRIVTDVDVAFGQGPIDLFCPRTRGGYRAEPSKVYPLDDFSRVWDTEGSPA